MTAKLMSENSQAFGASAFAAGLLGSCFSTCVPKGIRLCFAKHFASQTLLPPAGNAQTSARTMKRPARSGADTCLLSHCLCLFPSISTSPAAAELLHRLARRIGVGEMV